MRFYEFASHSQERVRQALPYRRGGVLPKGEWLAEKPFIYLKEGIYFDTDRPTRGEHD